MTATRTLLPLLFLLLPLPARADVRLPALLGDHMVLQRNAITTVWGWADPGEMVSVTPSWQRGRDEETFTGVTREDGRFRVDIPTPEAGGPHTIRIKGRNEIELTDILIGEVWLCSGQSNMEWPLRATDNGAQAIAESSHPKIRLFHLKRHATRTAQQEAEGSWKICGPDTTSEFSAVAYYFGRELEEHVDVPVGLIESAWGGTRVEAWTRMEELEAREPRVLTDLAKTDRAWDEWETARAKYPGQVAAWAEKIRAVDPGYRAGAAWAHPALRDGRWATMTIPGLFGSVGLDRFDGTIWFRKTVHLPPSWKGKDLTLKLGAIDDQDVTFFNGVPVGAHEYAGAWNRKREYTIPGKLVRGGRSVLTVRAHDTGGAGGFSGKADEHTLARADGEGPELSLAGTWRYRVGVSQRDLPPRPTAPSFRAQHRPSALFNGMIAPVLETTLRGAIWYQGESNAPEAHAYISRFPTMIDSWRRSFGQGNFPFYFVQLAPFRYGNTAVSHELREAQRLALAVPGTGMAVTLDIGNVRDIHPRNKLDVGRRLALWARAKTYGQEIVPSGPLFRTAQLDGTEIRIDFDHVGSGLTTRDGKAPSHFVVAGEDRRFHPATARIEGNRVVVSSPDVTSPVAVRYAWTNDAEPNLANAEGLPASSFRSDDWEMTTALASRKLPRGYTIPWIDLDGETHRQVVVDKDPEQYLGHPTTVLLPDHRTMLAVYPTGHGRGRILYKRSEDAGLTWSDRLPVPDSWATSKEVPTIYPITGPDGKQRLILFSGLHPIRRALSDDLGRTWTELEPIGEFGGIVAMADLLRLEDGSSMALFHDDGRFIGPERSDDNHFYVYKTVSRDGGVTWSKPEILVTREDAGLCEPGLVRSPDGKQIAMLLRENYRKYNSFVTFSEDEGKTWSEPRELPAALTGDRHQLRYAPDGRLFCSFRDTTHVSPTKGDWVGWVGSYEDLVNGTEGQYRIRLKDNHVRADCAYPAVELLPDGTFVVTTYGHWDPGHPPYILSVRFTIEELDAKLRTKIGG